MFVVPPGHGVSALLGKYVGETLASGGSNRKVVDVSSGMPVDATSGAAYKPNAFDYFLKASTDAKNDIDDTSNYLNTSAGSDAGFYDVGSASGGFSSTPQQLQYIDAPYAEMYGMDASTAYQEALANTAYQRKVKDLQAAGLNPVLGYSGAGAASFYGTPAASYSGGVSYGSLGSGKSTSSAAETATKLQYWLPTLVNGVTNMAFTLGTKNGMTGYAAGTIAQNMVSGALGAIRNHAK